ncbi:hypothetical protein DOTSEDRAFT_48962 [Dothistroma septosporum NZE10]|uniref:Uncharacterized protein n=1 Tax=Dothistroma septosporum (strain NZE10 / CBS 128990) TaxID=675120 RepID=N1Q1H6_DOTSN|nr:hypothetical protein DOTSEDRAFT_48962 [Dothistroma septosporum NZE10]
MAFEARTPSDLFILDTTGEPTPDNAPRSPSPPILPSPSAPVDRPLDPDLGPWKYTTRAQVKERRSISLREWAMLKGREAEIKKENREVNRQRMRAKEERRQDTMTGKERQPSEERYEGCERECTKWEENFGFVK